MGSVDAISGASRPWAANQTDHRRWQRCGHQQPAHRRHLDLRQRLSPSVRQLRGHLRRRPEHRQPHSSRTTATVTPTTSAPLGWRPLHRQPRARLPVDRRLPADRRGLVHQHAARPRVHHVTHDDEHRARRLRLELLRHPGLLVAAVVPRARHRRLHGSEPGGLVGHRQLRLRRPRRRVPARQRREPAGPGPLRHEAPRAQQGRPGPCTGRPGSHCPVVLELHRPDRMAVGLRHGQRDADLRASTGPAPPCRSTRPPRTRTTGPTR